MSYEHLLVTDSDGVRSIVLNRPSKLNSWNSRMRAEMSDAIAEASSMDGLRALILSGAGRAFSAGEDVSEMDQLAQMGTRGFRSVARAIHDVFDSIEALEIPVIAAVEGVAAGGGFELTLSCDFRVVAENAKLVMPEAKVGLIPGSGGCSRLVRHIGLGRAKQLVMLGGSITAGQALEWGLATEVVPAGTALEAALEMAQRLKSFAPLALGMAKLVLNTCSEVDAESGRRIERLGQSVLKVTSDHREGVGAFMEKRAPVWEGR